MPVRDLIPLRGRPPKGPVMFEVERSLTAGDIIALATGNISDRHRVTPPPIQTVTASHRRAALLVAQGKSAVEVAQLVGRTPQRIRDLLLDPAFRDLVATFQNQQEDIYAEESRRMKAMAGEGAEIALIEIRDRLEDPEKIKEIPTSELRHLVRDLGDRSYLPPLTATAPIQPPVEMTFNFTGQGLKPPSKEDSSDEKKPITIDHEE